MLIVPGTLFLVFGQVLPVLLVAISIWQSSAAAVPALAALACTLYPRLAAVPRFRQPALAALLHPVGIMIFLAIQWYSWLRLALGRPSSWKGRMYRKPNFGGNLALMSSGILVSTKCLQSRDVATGEPSDLFR